MAEFMDIHNRLFGHYDYNHGGSSQSLTGGTTWLRLDNDATGSQTSDTQKPIGDSARYNPTTNQFDFTGLNIGDVVELRFTVSYTTLTPNTQIEARMNMGIGDVNNYQIPIRSAATFKNTDTYLLKSSIKITMDNQFTIDNPAQVEVLPDSNMSVVVNGWKVFVMKRSVQ